jgi:hypothetical protein
VGLIKPCPQGKGTLILVNQIQLKHRGLNNASKYMG